MKFLKKQSLIANTLILTATSFFTRTVGMVSIIYISHLLGADGVGFYQLITSIYMLAVVFASAGLSVSVSKLVAEELGKNQIYNAHGIMKTAFAVSFLISLLVALIFFSLAPFIASHIIQNTDTTLSLRILAMSIPFIAASSCFKGYFYACQKSIFPASGDILEQIVKLSLMIFLTKLYELHSYGSPFTAICLALTIGEMVSWSYLLSLYIRHSLTKPTKSQVTLDSSASVVHSSLLKHYRSTQENIPTSVTTRYDFLIRLCRVMFPIAIISYISFIFISAENALIPEVLRQFGLSHSEAMKLYGMIKGMVVPILFFPSAFLTAFSTTLIPEIAKANALGNRTRVVSTTKRVLELTFILSILVASIFLNYSSEIGLLVYKNAELGPILRILSLIVPFMYVEVVVDGVLTGLGEQVSCLKYSIIDCIFRITAIYFFIPFKGLYAFIGIMIISNILTSTLNFSKLMQSIKLKPPFSNWLFKPAVCALAGSTFSKLVINIYLPTEASLLIEVLLGILLCSVIYIFLLFLVESLTKEDVNWLRRHLAFRED